MVTLKRFSFALSLVLALAAATSLSARAQDHHDEHRGGGHPGGAPHAVAPHPGAPGRPGGFGGHPGAGFGHPGGGFARGGVHTFHGRDFNHFSPADRAMWRGGGWHHEWHNGRFGWWWGVGGAFYFYPEPIYPYPAYVADTVWTDPMAAAAPAGPGGYAPGYWYYCSANGTYYPYTPSCPVPWTPVAPQGSE